VYNGNGNDNGDGNVNITKRRSDALLDKAHIIFTLFVDSLTLLLSYKET
jgi:hypothetical protein